MSIWFLLAALAAGLTCGVHTFAGGKAVARPLLAETRLPPASKWLNYYCWHITTVLLAAMVPAYLYTAFNPQGFALAVFLTILSAALSALSAWVALKASVSPFKFPSTSLFAGIAFLGTLGIFMA